MRLREEGRSQMARMEKVQSRNRDFVATKKRRKTAL